MANPLTKLSVAIVDYGLGNLYSVRQACAHVGFEARLTSRSEDLASAAAVILPGVGAFGDAIQALERLDLVAPLKDIAASGKPLIGICLGLQLLMTESHEFGTHKGLDVISGSVVKFDRPQSPDGFLKVPHVGWNVINRPPCGDNADPWDSTPLQGLADGEYMYFVHSFYAEPASADAVLCRTSYGSTTFVSGVRRGRVYGFQFHPERSGAAGLQIYRNIANVVGTSAPRS